MEKQIKCEHCGYWNDQSRKLCSNCNGVLNEAYIKEQEELSKVKGMQLPLIEIKESDYALIKAFKHVFRVGQLIFFAIISFIAAISASTVH